MLLSENNVKSELSYAYLHAVAARAGFACEVTGRHSDDAGIDAILRARERFFPDSTYTDFTVEIQLKATSEAPAQANGHYAYWLKSAHYDKLRLTSTAAPRLLVVLFLPANPGEWLLHSEDSLIARRCAYWVSLRGALASGNRSGQTIHVPAENALSADALRALMGRFSRCERIHYALR